MFPYFLMCTIFFGVPKSSHHLHELTILEVINRRYRRFTVYSGEFPELETMNIYPGSPTSFTMFYRLGTTSFTIFWIGLKIIIPFRNLFFYGGNDFQGIYNIPNPSFIFPGSWNPNCTKNSGLFQKNVGNNGGFLRRKTLASRWMSGAFKWPWTRQDAMKIAWFTIQKQRPRQKKCIWFQALGEHEKKIHKL